MAQMKLKWNKPANAWVLDLFDDAGAPLATGLALVTGADLFSQLRYLRLGGQLICQTDHDTDAVPTFKNLGGDGHIYYLAP